MTKRGRAMGNTNGRKTQDLLDRVLQGKPDDTKARVYELVLRLGINPDDELFLVMLALGQLQVLVEDAPTDWQILFTDFQGELAEWSEINLETLNSLIRKAEHEETLALTSQRLVNSLIDLTAFSTELMKRLDKLPPPSSVSKLTSHIHELSEQLQTISHTQNQATDRLNRIQHALNQNLRSNVKAPSLPAWVMLTIGVLTCISFYNYTLLIAIKESLYR